MKKGTLVKMLCAAFAAVMAFAVTGCAGKSPTANNDKYVIGASGPLTGGASLYGTGVKNGAQLAVDEINAAGGLNGVLFDFVMTDDKHDTTKIANNYTSLYEKGMQVSLGCVTTAPCREFKEYAHTDNVFFMTPSATGDDVTEYDDAYQMCFSDSGQGSASAVYVKEQIAAGAFAVENIGILYKSDDPYSKGIYENFIKEFTDAEKAKMAVCAFVDGTTDYSSFAEQLKSKTFIFIPTYTDAASTFMQQAKGVVANDAIYFGCDGFDGIDMLEGFDIKEIPQEVSYLSHFNSGATTGLAGEFVQKYTAKYGVATLNQFAASAYDCVYAIYGAMKQAVESGKEIPVTISASDLCDILKDTFQSGYTFTGVTGTNIRWSATGTVEKNADKYIVKAAS